jgi:hypothetical protein
MPINIHIDPADKANVERMLSGIQNGASRVMIRAINRVLAGVRTDASTEIRKIITAKKKDVDATFKTTSASLANIYAAVESKGKPLPLSSFSTRQTTKGVSVQVRRDRSRTVIPGTFLATFESKHKAVLRRKWRETNQAAGAKNKRIAYGRLPRIYRLPVAEKFGPRVPDIMSNDEVMTPVLKSAGVRLHDRINHELEYELNKHK